MESPVQVIVWMLLGVGALAVAAVIIRDQRRMRAQQRQVGPRVPRAAHPASAQVPVPVLPQAGSVSASPPSYGPAVPYGSYGSYGSAPGAVPGAPALPPHPGYPAPPPATDTFAVLAIVFALLGGLLAIPFGHIALSRIKRTGAGGWDLAVVALVIGYIVLAVEVCVVVFVVSSGV